jgi:hypothetical protein
METMYIWQHREPHEDDYYRFVYFIPIKHPDGNYVLVGSTDYDTCKTDPKRAVSQASQIPVVEARQTWENLKQQKARYFLVGTNEVDIDNS